MVCLRQRWQQPRGILTPFDGSGRRAQCLQRKRHVVMRQPGLWIEPQGLGERIDRSLTLVLRQMEQSKIVMRSRVIRLKPQRDIEFFGRAGEVAIPAREISQLYMR